MTNITNLPAGTKVRIGDVINAELTGEVETTGFYTGWLKLTTGGYASPNNIEIVSLPGDPEVPTEDEQLKQLRYDYNKALIALAVAKGVDVEFEYEDAAGKQSERYVTDVELTHNGTIIGGQDDEAEGYRSFRIDRIQGVAVAYYL